MTVPVISAWSAVSPFGYGRDDFAAGLRSGRTAVVEIDREQWRVPDERAGLVPDFAVRTVLGRAGTRAMDRLTGLAVTAVGHLVTGADEQPLIATGEQVALVLGTTTGSQQSMTDITRDTLIHAKPFYIETAHIPNAIMNSPAGQCAIRYQLKGPNTTIAAGRTSALSALIYGRRLLRTGRARTVLCGAVEEYSVARAWWEWHSRETGGPATSLGEGCAMLRLEGPGEDGSKALADVLSTEVGVHRGTDLRAVLSACVGRALARSGGVPEQVWAISAGTTRDDRSSAEWPLLEELFGQYCSARVDGVALVGDTAGATAGFQLVAVLAAAAADPAARGRLAVITAVDRDGSLGCAVLRLR